MSTTSQLYNVQILLQQFKVDQNQIILREIIQVSLFRIKFISIINSFIAKDLPKKIVMIKRGLRIDDDSDADVRNQEKISLDANRKKTNFEKEMDNFLFGGIAPVKKRQPINQKSIQKKSNIYQNKQTPSKPNDKQIPKKTNSATKTNSAQIKTSQVQTTVRSQSSSRIKQQPEQAKRQSEKAKRQPEQTKGQVIANGSSILSLKPQKSFVYADNEHLRPSYIRKLRQVSEHYNFVIQNKEKVVAIDVTRSKECLRKSLQMKKCKNYKDEEFPPQKYSLGTQLQQFKVHWKKPQDHYKSPTFGKYIDPNDLKKGFFSSSKFISSLSAISQNQANIKRLIQDQSYNQNGFYFVRLFINSVWRYYSLDSYLPFIDSANGAVMSYHDSESDLWSSMIEKAYAKAFNGYDVFTRPQPRQYYLRDLTGAPTSNFTMDNPQIYNIIKKALDQQKIVIAVPKSNISYLGINPNFTLTVISTNGKDNLVLRNSWSTLQSTPKVQISKQGVLQLKNEKLLSYVSQISIAHIDNSYYTTTIQTKHKKQFYSGYKFIIDQEVTGFFSLSQFDQRMFPRDAYEYSPIRIIIQKKINDKECEYISGAFSHFSRNLDIKVNLKAGEYHIFCFSLWKYQQYDFYLSFYGSKRLNFVKICSQKCPNLINQGLQAYNVNFGKRSALGHCHQYVYYHSQTNQILITVENTSQKSYIFTQDLRKVNFQSLHLMNVINNNQSQLEGLTSQELQNAKQDMNMNRIWQIELKAKQKFTWIIATSEDYDPNNFRNWGFR